MELITIELAADIASPIPVFMEQDVESDPVGIETAESGHPAPPLKHFSSGLDVPRNHAMSFHGIIYRAIRTSHK